MRLTTVVPALGFLAAAGSFAAGALAVENTSQSTPAAANAASNGDAAAGAKLFADSGCGWCHEEGGKVAGKGPKLEGTARDDHFIKYRITHGKEGAMPSFGHQFNDQQIAELIAYIRSLKD